MTLFLLTSPGTNPGSVDKVYGQNWNDLINDLTGNLTDTITIGGIFRIKDAGSFYVELNHTATENRTITIPDATDTMALLAATQTFTNKTLTTPTIADFTNATHSHQNNAGGGQLDLVAATTGTLTVARGGTGATTLTGIIQGNGTSAFTATALGAANTVFKVNAGGTAVEFGTLADANIAAGAAIAYSKLALTNSIVDGDIVSITTRAKLPSAIAYLDEAETITAQWTLGANLLGGGFTITNLGELQTAILAAADGTDVLTITNVTGAVNANSRTWSNFVASSPTFSGTTSITGNAVFDNGFVLRWKDGGGTARDVLKGTGANVEIANDAAGNLIFFTDNNLGVGNLATRLTLTGNVAQATLTFSSTDLSIGANKIKMSNVNIFETSERPQVAAKFQSALANTGTRVLLSPSGSANIALLELKASSSTTIGTLLSVGSTGSEFVFEESTVTDPLLPIIFRMGGNSIITIGTSNTIDLHSRVISNMNANNPTFTTQAKVTTTGGKFLLKSTFGNGTTGEIGRVSWGTATGDDFAYILAEVVGAFNNITQIDFFTANAGAASHKMTLTKEGNLALIQGAKVYLDGIAATGNTYLASTGADIIYAVAGGETVARFRGDLTTKNGVFMKMGTVVPADADLGTGEGKFWVDEAGHTLNFKCKYSDGVTIKTIAGIALT